MDIKQKAIDLGLGIAEDACKRVVAELFDDAIDAAAAEVKSLIPGQVDDAIIDLIVGTLKAPAKASLLSLIDQIKKD